VGQLVGEDGQKSLQGASLFSVPAADVTGEALEEWGAGSVTHRWP
jgi:hypothetical protein